MFCRLFPAPALRSCFHSAFIISFQMAVFCSCTHSQDKISATEQSTAPVLEPFTLTCPAFGSGAAIPRVYTCDSANISPALHWNKVAGSVRSYALIMDDPDAPGATWVHWVVFNIPPETLSLQANFPKDSVMASGLRQGITSFGRCGYGGPCPPDGVHRYYFKLFALDTAFNLCCAATGEKMMLAVMKGHIIAESDLMGRYGRKGKD